MSRQKKAAIFEEMLARGMTRQQIADHFGCTINNVYAALWRRAKLVACDPEADHAWLPKLEADDRGTFDSKAERDRDNNMVATDKLLEMLQSVSRVTPAPVSTRALTRGPQPEYSSYCGSCLA